VREERKEKKNKMRVIEIGKEGLEVEVGKKKMVGK